MPAEYKEVRVTEPTAIVRVSHEYSTFNSINTALLTVCGHGDNNSFSHTTLKRNRSEKRKTISFQKDIFTNLEILGYEDGLTTVYHSPLEPESDIYELEVKFLPNKIFTIEATLVVDNSYSKFIIDEDIHLNDLSLV